jgi:hypothetical protein
LATFLEVGIPKAQNVFILIAGVLREAPAIPNYPTSKQEK